MILCICMYANNNICDNNMCDNNCNNFRKNNQCPPCINTMTVLQCPKITQPPLPSPAPAYVAYPPVIYPVSGSPWPLCASGYHNNTVNGSCQLNCLPGSYNSYSGRICIPDPSGGCYTGYHVAANNGNCVQNCPPGYHNDYYNGNCLVDCANGYYNSSTNGACLPNPADTCSPGYYNNGFSCVQMQNMNNELYYN